MQKVEKWDGRKQQLIFTRRDSKTEEKPQPPTQGTSPQALQEQTQQSHREPKQMLLKLSLTLAETENESSDRDETSIIKKKKGIIKALYKADIQEA